MTEKQRLKFDADQSKLFSFMGLPYPYNRPKEKWQKAKKGKVVSLSDMHVPYHNSTVLSHVIQCEGDAETLIIPGDLGDYYSKSRFRKTRHVKFCDELRSVFIVLELLATHFQNVKIMIGNHDNRPEKHMVKLAENDVDMLIMTESNMLEKLASHFDNIDVVGFQLDHTDIYLTHLFQHNDIVFTHGEISLKANSANLDRVQDYLNLWGKHLELKPFNVIAQGHNHRSVKDERGGAARFLLPTASNPFSIGAEYIYGSRLVGQPPAIGYTIFQQYEGVTDANESRNICFRVKDGKTLPLERTSGDASGAGVRRRSRISQ